MSLPAGVGIPKDSELKLTTRSSATPAHLAIVVFLLNQTILHLFLNWQYASYGYLSTLQSYNTYPCYQPI